MDLYHLRSVNGNDVSYIMVFIHSSYYYWWCNILYMEMHKERTRGMDEMIELRRAPGTCCPEPSCDYAGFDYSVCSGCGAECKDCKWKKENKK